MKKATLITILSFICGLAVAQSPNAQSSNAKLDASLFETLARKGAASGYAPLNSSSLVPPAYLFPGFSGEPDNTIWVKSGATFAALSGVSTSGGNITANNTVFTGLIASPNFYGIKIVNGSYPLLLRGGSGGERVMIDYGQTLGGALNSSRAAFSWSINNSGAFSFAGGSFNGSIDFNSSALSEVATIAGSGLSINMATPTITSSATSLSILTPTAHTGTIVASTAAEIVSSSLVVHSTFALNPTSADRLYGRKDTTNTWDLAQTFTAAPVVPNSSFTIAKTVSLQTTLDGLLKTDGTGAMSGNLNMTTSSTPHKVIGMANPSSAGDAVNLAYLQGNYVANPVATLTASPPLAVTGATGSVTISIPLASSSANGYLSSTNWSTFNNKRANFTEVAPLVISDGLLSIPQSSLIVDGYLSAINYSRFFYATPPSSSPWANGEIMIGNGTLDPVKATKGTLTAGPNVTVTNGPGSVTLSVAPAPSIAVSSYPKVSLLMYSSIAKVEVIGSSESGNLFLYTMPASSLAIGDTISVRVSGNYIASGTQDTITFNFGSSSMSITTSNTLSLTEYPYVFEAYFTVRTVGSPGTAKGVVVLQSNSVSGATTGNRVISQPDLIEVDTAANMPISVSVTTGAGAPSKVFSETATVKLN